MKRVLIILIILGIALSAANCGVASVDMTDVDSIKSYKDIPGVTQEEITAIEALKTTRASFSYGHFYETEAFILPDGTYAGFTTEFCELLSNLFDIPFVQNFQEEWQYLVDKLGNHSIDFTGDMTPTTERMQLYYMTHTIAERSLRIFTLTGSEEILTENDIDGLNIGFTKGSVVAEAVMKCYSGLSFNIVYINNFSDAAESLKSGVIDAFVEEGVNDPSFEAYDFIRSKEFLPLVYAPVSMTTANPELEPIISVVNKYIIAGGIDKLHDLYEKGNIEYAKYKLNKSFTDEERSYLDDLAARGAKVSVALEYENYPVSFYNEKDKEFQGFSLDILKEISNLTGIEFESVSTRESTWAETLEKLKTGEISMITQLLYSEARKDDFIWSTVPYAYSYFALLSKADYPNLANYQVIRSTVGTINKTAFEDIYHESFPDSDNTISYNSLDEGFDALAKGKIDLLMASEYILLTQTNYREMAGYKVNIRFSAPMDSLFGFNKDEVVLCSIIDKAQTYINTDLIVNGWTTRVFDYSKKFLTELMYYLIIFAVVLVFVLAIILFLFVNNKRLHKELEKMANMDSLTGIFNRRHFMEYALMQIEKSKRSNSNSFVVIFDLDHFKKVNDNYGHIAGDEMLKSIVERVKSTIRPYDLFARYGGEEFILFFTDVNEIVVQNLVERIRQVISKEPVEFDGMRIPITASFGIAFVTPFNNLDTAIKLADKALYRAKDEGRNRVVFYTNTKPEKDMLS